MTGTSVNWNNQICQIRSITSAFIEICLDHPRPSDLTWAITLPDSATPLTLSTPANWNTTGLSCDSGRGQLQRIDLLSRISSTAITRGNWILNVKDQLAGDAGSLIQWRVIIQGNT
jgi:subtilisin-like proprotein convertase family protein